VLRQKADAEEQGKDVERQKNWDWTIEENDNWEKKLARKARRADFEFHGGLVCLVFSWLLISFRFRLLKDDAHAARRRYKKDLDHIKPDLIAYNKQKEVAMGLAPGTLVSFNPTEGSSAVRILQMRMILSYSIQISARSDKPAATAGSGASVPRCQYAHIRGQQTERRRYRSSREQNQSRVRLYFCPWSQLVLILWTSIDKKSKFSRKRPNEDEGDITYINEHNRVFNKKV